MKTFLHPKSALLFVTALLLSAFLQLQLFAQFPAGFSQQQVATGITNPTVFAFAPDGRIFVAQQNGVLKVIKNGAVLPKPFVSLNVSSSGERGLLGIAFDPNFAVNNYVYLYYTLPNAANNRISRFTASGDTALAGSELIILNLSPLSSATNHNGGTMQFGADGKLYVGVGDNASGQNAQNLDTYHGKILRINSDGSVPAGNPFTGGTAARQRVWAYGMRNPYTLTIQPGTGRIYVNDVGQNTWEEINDVTIGGGNYGWPSAEGNSGNPAYVNPVYAYQHGSGTGRGCAITGGTFYNPSAGNYPAEYSGKYFFHDFCGNWLDVLTISGNTASRANFGTGLAGSAVGITTGPDGNLYYLSRSQNALYKIIYTDPNPNPVLTLGPVADAYVRDGANAGTNFGGSSELLAKAYSGSGYKREIYLRFNISGAQTTGKATLRLYGSLLNTDNPSAIVQVLPVSNVSWGEQSINWNNKPQSQTVIASVVISGTIDKYYEWDISAYVKSQIISGADFISLKLISATNLENNYVEFNSREAAANKPQLIIDPAGSSSQVLPVADAYVQNGTTANSNFGTSTEIIAKKTSEIPYMREIFLRFDISDYSSDQKAILNLTGRLLTTNYSSAQIQILPVSSVSWAENSITWNNKPAAGSQAIAMATITGTNNQLYKIDLSEYVRERKISGAQFISIKIVGVTDMGNNYIAFFSREAQQNKPLLSFETDNTTRIEAIADAHIQNGVSAALNFGNSTTIISKATNDVQWMREIFIKFDISTIPAHSSSASLRMFGSVLNASDPSVSVNIQNVANTGWSENTITWNNKPAADAAIIATKTVSGTSDQWYEWDLTDYIKQAKQQGKTLICLRVSNTTLTPSGYTDFNSREAIINRPHIAYNTSGQSRLAETGLLSESKTSETIIRCFPNPASGTFTAQVEGNTGGVFEMYDLRGGRVFQAVLSNSENTIDVSSHAPGIYVYRYGVLSGRIVLNP